MTALVFLLMYVLALDAAFSYNTGFGLFIFIVGLIYAINDAFN